MILDEYQKINSSSQIWVVKSLVTIERVIRDLLKINFDNNETYKDCSSEPLYAEKTTKHDCLWGVGRINPLFTKFRGEIILHRATMCGSATDGQFVEQCVSRLFYAFACRG